MKIVRKLLRLLPFIYFCFYFLYIILFKSYSPVDLTNNSQYIFMNIEYISSLLSGYMSNFLASFNLINFADNLVLFFSGGELFFEDLMFLGQMIIFIPFYELFLSLIFIFFDVFNFIIGIASNWLRKGESLNE